MAKKIEIDEDEYNRLARTMGVLSSIAANPSAAKLVEQAHKMVDPNAPTPKLEASKPIDDAVAAMNKRIEEFEKKQTDREAQEAADRKLKELQARQDQGWSRIRADKSWTAEGIKKIQEVMDAKGVLDPEDAALIVLRDNPPPPPAMPGATGAWNFFEQLNTDGDADIKKLIETKGENSGLLDKMSHEALLEVRGQRR